MNEAIAVSLSPHPTLDPELLRRAVAGDRAAQGHVARHYYPSLRRWALLETGDRQRAQDAVQEALLAWVRHAHTYDPSRPFEPWLRSLVRNASRRRGRRRVLDWLPSWSPRRPDQVVDVNRNAKKALDALGQLTPRQRDLVDLCDLQGFSAADAARELGLNPSTARVHLHDGRKRLESLLDDSVRDLLKETS